MTKPIWSQHQHCMHTCVDAAGLPDGLLVVAVGPKCPVFIMSGCSLCPVFTVSGCSQCPAVRGVFT
eukprot:7186918-Alexandrium_andersonii.AAC.1